MHATLNKLIKFAPHSKEAQGLNNSKNTFPSSWKSIGPIIPGIKPYHNVVLPPKHERNRINMLESCNKPPPRMEGNLFLAFINPTANIHKMQNINELPMQIHEYNINTDHTVTITQVKAK